jgi:hypothetical protein
VRVCYTSAKKRLGYIGLLLSVRFVCPSGCHTFSSLQHTFKFCSDGGKSNVKSVERRGIKIKKTQKFRVKSSLIDTPVRAKFKSVLERRKSVTTGRTNEPNGQQKSP